MYNYATHKTPLIRSWLAKRPRWHVHFDANHSSWFNQIERFFALITERKSDAASIAGGCTTRRDHVLHRTSQRRSKAVPMSQISRRYSQLNRTLLRLQFPNKA
jgi:hypothetical protein